MSEQQQPPVEPAPSAWAPPEQVDLQQPSFVRRNWCTLLFGAIAVGAIAVAIGILASDSGGSTPTAASAPSTTPTASSTPSAAAKQLAAKKAMRATIVSESGSTWSVRTMKGATVTVTITGQTQFGTPKTQATIAQFPVGSSVIITGNVDSGAVTASRVAAQRADTSASPPASSTPTQS